MDELLCKTLNKANFQSVSVYCPDSVSFFELNIEKIVTHTNIKEIFYVKPVSSLIIFKPFSNKKSLKNLKGECLC